MYLEQDKSFTLEEKADRAKRVKALIAKAEPVFSPEEVTSLGTIPPEEISRLNGQIQRDLRRTENARQGDIVAAEGRNYYR